MSFKQNINRDLDAVFFNADEFADVFTHNGIDYKGIWRDKSEVVIDGVTSFVPWVVVQSDIASTIKNGDTIDHAGETWHVVERQRVDDSLIGLYVSKDARRSF